jgi:hypothetical protein
MKLTYLPDELLIVQDDPDRPIVATVILSGPSAQPEVDALGRLMAAAPTLLGHLHNLTEIEADKDGDRTVSAVTMAPIWEAIIDLGDLPLQIFIPQCLF